MSDLKKEIQKVSKKYDISFSSKKEGRDFVNIHNILEAVFGEVDSQILFDAYLNRGDFELKTANDYYFLVTNSLMRNRKIKKTAYPLGMGALTDDVWIEADLDKWVKLVHMIYKSVNAGHMSFASALEHYSQHLNKKNGEVDRFKKWILYYKNGEHEKYAEEATPMKKKSDYQFGLNSSVYPRGSFPADDSVQEKLVDLEDKKRKEEEFEVWKSKVNGAIRRIDKLLRSDEHLTPEEQADLAEMLHAFDLQVRRVRLQSTASDITYRTADRFKKVGYNMPSEILLAVAQELAEAPLDAGIPGAEAPGAPVEAPENPVGAEAPGEAAGPSEAIGRALTKGEPVETSHGDVFDELAGTGGQIDLGQAAVKLEEVAARLADRRTIRQLAEFDIMLDKLGIASLFPELAEAQSKLIDAYSYALVRVTKMLGMLSSGRSMDEISDAKKTDISNKAVREVNKTLQQGEEPVAGGKGTEAISQEFGPAGEGAEAQPAPVE